jgi:hypothetical protein
MVLDVLRDRYTDAEHRINDFYTVFPSTEKRGTQIIRRSSSASSIFTASGSTARNLDTPKDPEPEDFVLSSSGVPFDRLKTEWQLRATILTIIRILLETNLRYGVKGVPRVKLSLSQLSQCGCNRQ